ncbi:MTH1187 family thiamine-binding protein [Chloroflexota bacterium]
MAIIQVSVVPLGIRTSSVGKYVARALSVLENEKDVAYQLTPMGTIIEGNLDQVLRIVKQMHETVFDTEVQRVLTTIIIDDRRDKTSTMDSKVNSVRSRLHAGASPAD